MADIPDPPSIDELIDKLPERSMQFKITTYASPVVGSVCMDVEDYAGEIERQVMHTKEKAIREALIALGWTPPKEGDERANIAEWWNANNSNEMITGAYSGVPWDELPEWAQESAIKLYKSCQH